MKRSDVLELMVKVYHDINPLYKQYFTTEDAHDILYNLEKAGMKPPTVKVLTPMGSQTYFYTNEWEENINVDDAGYEKEPENEEK